MKKLLLVSLCFLLLSVAQVFAQSRTITGTVIAKEDGGPIPGVNVSVKGTTIGVTTGADGKYSIKVPDASSKILVFRFIGYGNVEKPLGGGSVVNATMEVTARQLGEVVINTAFGVKKSSGDLGYSATSISTQELTEAGATNFTNGLTAKVAGLVVTTGDAGINPSTRFILRGNRHFLGNNFALVVLNGVPISPNDVNTINPDDIESTDILNGPGAAALYGSEASNGALVITTKKGTRTGAPAVTFSTNYQFEKMSYFPNLQERFGSYGGEGAPYQDAVTGFITTVPGYENQSYGAPYDGHLEQLGLPLADGTVQKFAYAAPSVDPRFAFFQTGHSASQNVSYATGDLENSFNFSANHLDKTNPTPGEAYTRDVVRVSATKTYGKFKAEFTASYTSSNTNAVNANIWSTLLNTPSWVPITSYQDITAPFADRSTYFNSYDVNVYSTIHDVRINQHTDAFNGSFKATYSPTNWLDISYNLADNFGTLVQQSTTQQINYSAYALTNPGGTGNRASSAGVALVPGAVGNFTQFGDGSGSSGAGPQGYSRLTQDVQADFHHTFFTDFKTDLRVGSTIWQEYLNSVSNGSTNLIIENFYNVSFASGIATIGQNTQKIRQIGTFGDLSIGYKNFATIEGTLRNEVDSRLSEANRSIWFPGVNGSVILTNAIPALKNNKYLSYLKLRGSYAQVGDVNIGPYGYVPNSYGVATNFPYGSVAGLSLSTTLNNPNLKSELTSEVEFGADLGLFDGRINGGVTYYDDRTTNQTIPISISSSSGYTSTLINAGEMQTNGLEFTADIQALTKAKNKVDVDLRGNFAIQDSKVISVLPTISSVSLGSNNEFAIVDLPYPELMGSDLLRDPQGHPIVNATTGYPSTASGLVNLGRITPKYILGLTQSISYKFMTLSVTEEFRTGNVFLNSTERTALLAGSDGFSASNGRERFIFPNSVINTGTAAAPVYVPNTNVAINDGNLNFWDSGSFETVNSTYTTSAAFWKVREASLAFDLSQWARKTKAIKKASFVISGRNLFMWTPASNRFNTDPEFGSTGNAGGVQTSAILPPTRLFGGTLTLTF